MKKESSISEIITIDNASKRAINVDRIVCDEEDEEQLSPSFKQENRSFFQKQKASSNKVALTPTKQKLIRAFGITSMFDFEHIRGHNIFKNKNDMTASPSENQNNIK